MKIVCIVPTKDRPVDIQNLFESILKQTRMPDMVIVVDGSDNPIEGVIQKYSDKVNLKYLPCRPPSLPKQRNLGIKNIPEDADWVGFLDDDLALESDTLKNLEEMIKEQNNSRLKGIGLSIINQPVPRTALFNRLFMIGSKTPGKVTKAAYPTPIPCVSNDIFTDWIYGGATFWGADVFKTYQFDEWFFGTGYMEDIDFSYRISRNYDLMISSKARCYHYHHGIPVHKEASIGEWQITSWWYFATKYNDFYRVFVFWGMFGLVLKNIFGIFINEANRHFLRAKGHWKGLVKVFNGTALDLKGFSK